MSEVGWQGDIWLARDHAVFYGCVGDARSHAHYAHQLMVGLGQPVTVALDTGRQQASRLLIPSWQRHALQPSQMPQLVLFAEPLAFDQDTLVAWLPHCPDDPAGAQRALQQLPRRPLDPRLQQALVELDQGLDGKVPSARLATAASLSLSQLARLFSDQLGVSVRRLVLWRRLHLATALVLQGYSLTDAAHHAGFADSAHLSRTVRSLLGIRADLSLTQLRVMALQ
ncbi:AraC family transcriptional regulator [Isoalcanivorax beigongshangi]|uniref:Helix-turn-helix domain-containing protein n=1 Tax=Isoalcanivorax beigongshangi TaxID=3238810 RepID=A0ABV4AMU2_9GAMM